MTVGAIAPGVDYTENGATLAFPVPFRFLAGSDLVVTRTQVGVAPVVLAYGSGFTATGGATDAGGTVTLVASVAGARLSIRRRTARAQQTDYVAGGTFPAESHEAALDRAMLIDQEQDVDRTDLAGRALLVPVGEAGMQVRGLAAGEGLVLGVRGGAIVPVTGTKGDRGDPGIFSKALTGWTLPIGPVMRGGYVTTTATVLDVAETLAALLSDLQGAGVLVTAGLLYRPEVMFAVQFQSTNGQSLAQGHVGGMNVTLAQDFQAKAFPTQKTTTTFADLVPAIATNLALSTPAGGIVRRDGEAPIFGQLRMGYILGNLLVNVSAEQRVGINQGVGSTAIAVHVKGQTYYNNTLNAANAAKNYATSIGKTIFDMGFAWFQGESNAGNTKTAYYTVLVGLARDMAADRKAITGQADDPAMFTYITASNSLTDGTRNGVARAQHQAAIDYFNDVVPAGHSVPAPVILATPMHFMGFQFDATGLHVGAEWADYLGSYVALAQYQCYMKKSALPLNKRWPPIIPIDVAISGADATITYQLRAPGTALAFGVSAIPNGDGFAKQTNYGFAVWDGASLLAIADPVIVAANKIRITLAAGGFAAGYRIGYALDRAADHHLYFKGGAGNVRDNFGATTRDPDLNLPMHNWMAPHDVILGAGSTWSIA